MDEENNTDGIFLITTDECEIEHSTESIPCLQTSRDP